MIKIAMIRHGKTYGNTLGRYIGVTDEPLCEEGKKAVSYTHLDVYKRQSPKRRRYPCRLEAITHG